MNIQINGNAVITNITDSGGFPDLEPKDNRADKISNFSSRQANNKLKTNTNLPSLSSQLKTSQSNQETKLSQTPIITKSVDSHSIKTVKPLNSIKTPVSISALTKQPVSANSNSYQPISAMTTSTGHELSTTKTTINEPYTSSISSSAIQNPASANITRTLHQTDSASRSLQEASSTDVTRSQSDTSSVANAIKGSASTNATIKPTPLASSISTNGESALSAYEKNQLTFTTGSSNSKYTSSVVNLTHSQPGNSSAITRQSVDFTDVTTSPTHTPDSVKGSASANVTDSQPLSPSADLRLSPTGQMPLTTALRNQTQSLTDSVIPRYSISSSAIQSPAAANILMWADALHLLT